MSLNQAFAPVINIVKGLELIGINLIPDTVGTSIYIWQSEGRAIYVGKKTLAKTRSSQERKWSLEVPNVLEMEIPFSRTMYRLGATMQEFRIAPTDFQRLNTAINYFDVTGKEYFSEYINGSKEFTNDQVEAILIRSIVQAGYVLSNSEHTGQWDVKNIRLHHFLGSLVGWVLEGTQHNIFKGLEPRTAR